MALEWYVVRSKPRREHAVAHGLASRLVENYYPTLRVRRVNPRARKIMPLFPGYLFLRIDTELTPLSEFNYMPDTRGLVLFEGKPARMPEPVIEAIRQQVDALLDEGGGVFDPFKPGDRVRVLSGPFRDYEGVFDMRLRGTDRVRILLEMVGQRSAALQLRESQIGK